MVKPLWSLVHQPAEAADWQYLKRLLKPGLLCSSAGGKHLAGVQSVGLISIIVVNFRNIDNANGRHAAKRAKRVAGSTTTAVALRQKQRLTTEEYFAQAPLLHHS